MFSWPSSENACSRSLRFRRIISIVSARSAMMFMTSPFSAGVRLSFKRPSSAGFSETSMTFSAVMRAWMASTICRVTGAEKSDRFTVVVGDICVVGLAQRLYRGVVRKSLLCRPFQSSDLVSQYWYRGGLVLLALYAGQV